MELGVMTLPSFYLFDARPLADAPLPSRGGRLDGLLAEQDIGRVAGRQQESQHGPVDTLERNDCTGHQQHFGQQRELNTLFTQGDAHELAGALSLSEMGSLRAGDYPLFHNGAILCNGARPS